MPTKSAKPVPFHWSHTRDQTFQACPRRYFYRYRLAPGAWRRDAAPEAQRAFLLSQLTTWDLVLGNEIHARARELAHALVKRKPKPTAPVLRDRTRAALNRLYQTSKSPERFFRDPAGFPLLLSTFYDRDIGSAAVERVRTKMTRCLAELVDSPVWGELAQCAPADVRVIDQAVCWSEENLTVWAAPDLVYLDPSARPVILDWKTGRADRGGTCDQLYLYAWYVRDVLKLPVEPFGFEGRVVELASGNTWSVDFQQTDIEQAREQFRNRALALRDLHLDGSLEDFPLTSRPSLCRACPFWEFCETKLRDRALPFNLQPAPLAPETGCMYDPTAHDAGPDRALHPISG